MSAQEFLQQRAVDLTVGGRYSMTNWYDPQGKRREFACRATRMSPFRMLISVPVMGKIGDRVISHFDAFGKLEGWITDTVKDGFLLDLDADKTLREKLARQLSWLEKQQRQGVVELRVNGRVIPKDPLSTLVLADGTYRACFIIDMSVSGAAVSADVQPPLGTPLAIGACVGRVIRHFAEGFAVKFIEVQNEEKLERLIARAITRVAQSKAAERGLLREMTLVD